MKKFLFITSALCLGLLISCSDKKDNDDGMSETAKKNLDAHHAIVKMFESADWSKCGDYIAADAVDHGGSPTGGDIVGLDSIKANFDKMGMMMGDMKNKVVKELADDDYVMSWMEQSSTAKVDMPEWGMKKGQTSTYNSIEVSKYKNGKITDHWSFMSPADMMKMMGGASQMPPADHKDATPPKDSTNK